MNVYLKMLFELLEQAQLLAIESAISPSEESIYRLKCRQYSEKFFTPLHLVEELDPMRVFLALAEDQYHPSVVQDELEELLEKLYKMQDPNYSKMDKQEMEDMVDAVLNKELKRLGKKNPKKSLLDKKTSEKEKKPIPPKMGSMSFENLEKADEASEAVKGGFKD